MKAVVFTLGCKVNQCESASLMKGLSDLGWEVSDQLGYADLYVLNTCAVTAEAEKKSRQLIARVRKYNKNAKIIVTGCASEKSSVQFEDKEDVFLITGAKSKDKIIDLLNSKGVFIEEKDEYYERFLPIGSSRTRSYIKIQDGCNNFCSYCIIPYLRGRSRSRDPQNIIKEIESLNPTEAVVTGINLSDFNFNGTDLADLLIMLKDFKMRIRLGSLEVGVINKKLLEATKVLYNFAPHFHLSLQSGSNKVLESMNRKYTREEYKEKVDLIRSYYPNAGITTDIIVGFSTETISDFEDSISLVKDVEFSDVHCFPYSRREGTKAYEIKEIPSEVKKERLQELMRVKAVTKKTFIQQNIGLIHVIIPEETVGDYVVGYTGNYIKVYVDKNKCGGESQRVRITEIYEDGAKAEIIY